MTVAEKLNCEEYKFILDNIRNDALLSTSQKKEFEDYISKTELDSTIDSRKFESKVNNDFFYPKKSTEINSIHRSHCDRILGNVQTKKKFYQNLKTFTEKEHPEIFESETDFISNLEYGTGNLVDRIGFISIRTELGGSEFGYKMMWSTFSYGSKESAFSSKVQRRKLPCILGLDDETISSPKYLINHKYAKYIFKPTSFDAGFNKLWGAGGKTKPRKLWELISCESNECDNCDGVNEVVHKPNILNNILNIEILS